MAEYIEREQVKDELLSWAVCINHPEHLLKEDALCVIDAIPAADVVPVVRCKDCDNWCEEMKCGHADLGNAVAPCSEWSNQEDGHLRYTSPNDFCSYGERRDSDG